MSDNPLLIAIDSPMDYAAIRPEHLTAAIPKLIERSRAAIDRVAAGEAEPDWDTLIEPLLDATQVLGRAWSVAGHLNAVVNTPELRAAYNECLPLMTEYGTWVSLHEGLYHQYQRLRASPGFAGLNPVRRRIVTLALRDFRLGGADLEGEARERYRALSDEQARTSQKFSENVLDSVDQWSLVIEDESRLAGIPPAVLTAAREAAREDGLAGWKLNLKMPCYLPVMQYAHDRALRESLYRGHATLASELGEPGLDNSPMIERLLALRAEEAALLGFDDFAALRLETRMADSSPQVLAFLRELARRARPHAEHDLAELRAHAAEHLGLDALQPWDLAYASEHLRQQRYDYSEEAVRQYFSVNQVLDGLFRVVDTLFGVQLEAVPASAWHPDVQCYAVRDGQGELRGHLNLDLYARQGKQGGAWVGSERERRRHGTQLHTPIVNLTCNFTPPLAERPSLLTHDEVITLFHESGHALHALLSTVDDPDASAFAAVEWDAIELPSQFMENFCWEWPVIQAMGRHIDTGEPLPRTLFDRLLAARNFQSGMQMLRQVEFALFDMLIHQRKNLVIADVLAVLHAVREEVAVVFPPEWQRFPHQFSHLFAGGYGAGYYSYKWAEVLSADAYAAFEESAGKDGPILDPATGRRFLKEILAVGGSRPAADSFRAFRGRDPDIEALLRHSGMSA
ncbi:MAG: M3 family metallopeptidase [Castellaniella sp.]